MKCSWKQLISNEVVPIRSGTVYVVQEDGVTLEGPNGENNSLTDFVNKTSNWVNHGVKIKVNGTEVDTLSGEYPEGTTIEIGE